MENTRQSLRPYLLLMFLSGLWALAGAPLLPEEWAALPDNTLRILRQIPRRMLLVLAQWLA